MNRTIARSAIGAVAVTALLGVAVTPSAQTPAPAAATDPQGPVQLTRDQAFQRERDLLGLTGDAPKGATNNVPETFDESKANPYTNLPDPLKLNNGQRVTSTATWNNTRRAELLEIFEREIYGRTPKTTPKVTWMVVKETREMNGEVPIITKQLMGRVDNTAFPGITVTLEGSLSTPANATGKVPVILTLSAGGFGGRGRAAADAPPRPLPATSTCGLTAPPAVPAGGAQAPAAGRVAGAGAPAVAGAPAAAGAGRAAGAPGAAAAAPGAGAGRAGGAAPAAPNDQQQALALGWGYASFNTSSVQADNGQSLTCGIIGLVNKGQPRKADDWGVLAAWGWGASRMLDYFETDSAVDATRVGLYGHSRWGKATLLTTVLDKRFAIAYVSSAGQGGSKLHRRQYGETVDNVANNFFYWMGANYIKYAGKWDSLPVDSHELIALMAPRPVFFSGGNEPQKNPDGTLATQVNAQGQTVLVQAFDAWVDPRGTFMAAVAAAPVYELVGKKGLGVKDFPPVNTEVIAGDLGFRQHAGGHTSGPAWETFYKFAGKYLKK